MKRLLFLLALLPLFSYGQRIKPGDHLPELNIHPVFLDSVPSFKGKKILFTFNRYVSCPLCNFRTHELIAVYDTLKKNNLIIISVYESKKETLAKYTQQEQIPFLMVADPKEKLYKKFKVKKSWRGSLAGLFKDYNRKHSEGKKLFKSEYKRDGSLNRIGADFLVDENGIIQVAYYGKFVGDHLPIADILKWVKSK